MFICTPRVVKPRAALSAPIQSPDSNAAAKFGSGKPEILCRSTLLSEAATKSQGWPITSLSPLSAPVDGAQNSDAFLRHFLREKAKLAPGCFRRGGGGENDRMMVDGRRLIYATEVTN